MRIKLTSDIKLIGGEMLYAGAEFDVLEDEPLIGNKPKSLRISVDGTSVALFSSEFAVLERADEKD